MQIHLATIEHGSGTNFYISTTEEGLTAQLYEFVTDYWGDLDHANNHLSVEPPEDKGQAIREYFDSIHDEYLNFDVQDIDTLEPAQPQKPEEVPPQDLLDALKDLYRLVEGTSGEIYETMNPYSRWQMQKAGRILNRAHGLETKSAIFELEG